MNMNCLKEIKDNYAEEIEKYFHGTNIEVDCVHDNKDFVIRCNNREILNSILMCQKKENEIHWNFRESFYGKYIMTRVSELMNKCKNPSFVNIYKYYKKEYVERINLIICRYRDDIKFKDVIEKYNELMKETYVDYEKYKELRNEFDELRK